MFTDTTRVTTSPGIAWHLRRWRYWLPMVIAEWQRNRSEPACPYCGQVDPEPSTHLTRVHPVVTSPMEWCDVCPDPKIRHTAPGGACVACECDAYQVEDPSWAGSSS